MSKYRFGVYKKRGLAPSVREVKAVVAKAGGIGDPRLLYKFLPGDNFVVPHAIHLLTPRPLAEVKGWELVDSWLYDPSVEKGMEFKFELRLSPQVSLPPQGKRECLVSALRCGKVVLSPDGDFHFPETKAQEMSWWDARWAAVRSWLGRRQETLGFKLNSVDYVYPCTPLQVPKHGFHLMPPLDVVGRLQVTDPVLFRKALLEGVGPSKVYGCGWLRLLP